MRKDCCFYIKFSRYLENIPVKAMGLFCFVSQYNLLKTRTDSISEHWFLWPLSGVFTSEISLCMSAQEVISVFIASGINLSKNLSPL